MEKELTLEERFRLGIRKYGFDNFIPGWNAQSAMLKYPTGHLEYLEIMNVPTHLISNVLTLK